MNVINNNGLEYCDNEFGRIEIEVRKVMVVLNFIPINSQKK